MDGVSVIICCYNSADRIVPTLQHLQLQEFDKQIPWEVIIIDNASTDATATIARKVWEQKPVTSISVFGESNPGLMNARKKGCEVAQFGIVSFIDDDNWVEPHWVEKVYNQLRVNEKIGACGSRNEPVFEETSPEWFELFKNNFAVGRQANESGVIDSKRGYLWGAGLSFKKKIWHDLQQKHYITLTLDRQKNTLSSGGDTELCYAIRLMGYDLYYNDELVLKHYMPRVRMNFSYLERLIIEFGRSNVALNYYRVLLEPDFKLYPWFYEWLASKKKILELRGRLLFASEKQKKWGLKADIAYWKGYADQMWRARGRTRKTVSNLKTVFFQEQQ